MMSKRETIILSVLINIGLLAILFLVAVHPSDDNVSEEPELGLVLEEPIPLPKEPEMAPVAIVQATTGPRDEVDDVLFGSSDTTTEVDLPPPPSMPFVPPPPTKTPSPQSNNNQPYIEIAVKKGDALEKIARANRTTVEDLKRLNNLTSARLDIGQILRVPVNSSKPIAVVTAPQEAPPAPKVVVSNEPIYHVIKSGDNPWKIARQYKVKYEDILKLNNMNEEKARNLKVGEKIRVK